jgi:two-component system sensor kinase FixL
LQLAVFVVIVKRFPDTQQTMGTPRPPPASRSESKGDDERLETLLQNLPGMAYRCLNLKHWPMDFVSDGCFDLCGYHRHEIESNQVLWGDFTHPEMIEEVDRKVRSATEKGQPFEIEYRIITRKGEEKWVWERGRVIDHRDDGVAILEGFITDITARKLTEYALMRAEAYAQAIVDSAVEAVITIDSEGSIETFNKAASAMFGYEISEIRGRHCRSLVAVNYYRDFEQYFQQSINKIQRSKNIEIHGHDKDNREFPMVLSMHEIHDEQVQNLVLLIRDLTDQRAAEKEVRVQRDMLAHVDRLNTQGEMAAGIAHEINQPLTAISMYAQSGLRFLQRDEPQIKRLEEALEKLSQQAHRAGAMIERMQEMTRQHESYQKTVDTRRLLHECRDLGEIEAQIRKFVIVLRLDDNLPQVKCDPIQIQQVVLNLLRNGMESMQENRCGAGSKIVIQARIESAHIKIAIIDSGKGISRKLEKQLYQPFTSSKKSGMGLGLSISRSIINAHGGQLEFTNNNNGGATFFFSLETIDES